MKNVWMGMVWMVLLGAAMAQAPEDYTLLCDGDVFGTAAYVDGELRVALSEGVTCEGTVSVGQDGDLIVTLELADDGATLVTITDLEGSVSAVAEAGEVPQVAIDGMATAQEQRAEAGAEADTSANAEEGAENAEDGIENAADAASTAADKVNEAAGNGSANADVDADVAAEANLGVDVSGDVTPEEADRGRP